MQELVEKATSENNTGEDWSTMIEICELADTSEETARQVLNVIGQRFFHPNVNVILFSLVLANSLFQNCSLSVRKEISSRTFLNLILKLLENPKSHNQVKDRILVFLESWANESKGNVELGYLWDFYSQLRDRGFLFPSQKSQIISPTNKPPAKKFDEEEQLQLALAISLSEQESKKMAPSKLQGKPQSDFLFQVRVLYPFQPSEQGEIPLEPGQIVSVVDDSSFKDWYKGSVGGLEGMFPANYVQLIPETVKPGTIAHTKALLQQVDEFVQLLNAGTDEARIQELYSTVILQRPQILSQIEQQRRSLDELNRENSLVTDAIRKYLLLQQKSVYAQPAFAYPYQRQ